MMRRKGITAVLLGLLLALSLSTLSVAGPATDSGVDPSSWNIVEAPGSLDLTGLITPPAISLPGGAKIDSGLTELASGSTAVPGVRSENGRFQVQIEVEPGSADAVREVVEGAGGLVTSVAFDNTILQAWLPASSLRPVASDANVLYIQPPPAPVLADVTALATELTAGVAASNASAWHAAGFTGQAIKIAIIDGGFLDYPDLLGVELPASVTVKNFVDLQDDAAVDGTTRHGTACAEIVHDMAPDAELFLLKIATDADLDQAVNYAISQGVDVISTSLAFINVTPGDGTGRFATLATAARNAGIVWITASGNYRETHWGGAFQDADGDGLHEFAAQQEVNFFGPGTGAAYSIPPGVALQASIRWDDWTAVNQDYDLHIVRYNGSTFDIIRSSTNAQSGGAGQRPRELTVHVTSGLPTVYGVIIERKNSNRNVHFELLTPNRELDKRVTQMSLGNLADVADVFTVSAVDIGSPFPLEDYSSEGPINGPGGAPTGGTGKPDLAAFANVDTASYGSGVFNGTSAATPHVAGAAALVLAANPGYSPSDVRQFLQDQAIDQGIAGRDTQFGYGRLFLGLSEMTYSISGTVTTGGGAPLAGVAIDAGNGLSTQTNASGVYTLTDLPADTYTLTATKSGYTFSPSSRQVTVPQNATGQDFVGTELTYSVSGSVQDSSGMPLAGVWINAGAGNLVQTDSSGVYQFPALPAGTYTLTAAKAGYLFTPQSRVVTLPPDATVPAFTGSTLAYSVLLPVVVNTAP